jgi:hypothetical protein
VPVEGHHAGDGAVVAMDRDVVIGHGEYPMLATVVAGVVDVDPTEALGCL